MNPYSYDIQTLERKARAVRRHIVRLNANSPAGGHTGADLSQVELLTALHAAAITFSSTPEDTSCSRAVEASNNSSKK